MKLYYSPGACSLSPHIVLWELGVTFDLEKVDLRSHKTETGQDFRDINPNGYVPVLLLDDGQVLIEASTIVQYLADQAPAAGLAPATGSMEHCRLVEWLGFISTELHKGFAPLFNPELPRAWSVVVKDVLDRRLAYVEKRLAGSIYVMGDQFTIADAYLFTLLNWGKWVGVDIGQWPVLDSYMDRISSRPTVQSALRAEGLL